MKRKHSSEKNTRFQVPIEDTYQMKDLSFALMEILLGNKHLDKVLEKNFNEHSSWSLNTKKKFRNQLFYGLYNFNAFGEKSGHTKSSVNKVAKMIFDGATKPPAVGDPELDYSVPLWLYEKIHNDWGEQTHEILKELNHLPPLFIRINTLRAKAEEVKFRLEEEEIGLTATALPDAFLVEGAEKLFRTSTFHDGLLEVQDLHSQAIVNEMQLKPGLKVADTCAGAGGKSLQIATLLQNKGKVIALDIKEYKLKELQRRVKRNGIDCVEARLIEGQKTLKRLEGFFDRVLIDAPCSGTGVWRRNPDSKFHLSQEHLQELEVKQAEILTTHSKLCKSGGLLFYATCSILKEEGEHQVKKFLEGENDFELINEKRWWPEKNAGDGFYLAVLKRK